ncbi:MAG: hypothetical protein D6782_03325 [Alphaproteobacteria bacterium]|nr:MAG: hypothetical protein D6782_03325 [Alphaproteobacteria bacterium]
MTIHSILARSAAATALALTLAACDRSADDAAPEANAPEANAEKPETAQTAPDDPIAAAVADPDRTEDDRARDAGRKPGEVLAF